MHLPNTAKSFKDLKSIMGENKIYVVTEKDYKNETSTILASFKTIASAQSFAKSKATKCRRDDEYLQEQYASFAVLDSVSDDELYSFVIEEIEFYD